MMRLDTASRQDTAVQQFFQQVDTTVGLTGASDVDSGSILRAGGPYRMAAKVVDSVRVAIHAIDVLVKEQSVGGKPPFLPEAGIGVLEEMVKLDRGAVHSLGEPGSVLTRVSVEV